MKKRTEKEKRCVLFLNSFLRVMLYFFLSQKLDSIENHPFQETAAFCIIIYHYFITTALQRWTLTVHHHQLKALVFQLWCSNLPKQQKENDASNFLVIFLAQLCKIINYVKKIKQSCGLIVGSLFASCGVIR